ncbi:SCO6745 family protein [Streptomyces sp. NPDC001985]|uniref:SCO6745 family protein n=1 Tax=Streptomyces sp. NPDC001985 TaxID=3154406 RepID=UPI00332C1159
MISEPLDPMARAGRRCHDTLNAMHATSYFSPDLGKELAGIGISDAVAPLILTRAAPLGPVGPGAVAAVFYNYNPARIARYLPAAWETASPQEVLRARLRAVDTTLRRLLGDEVLASDGLAEAAELALRAAEGCRPHARPLYAAHAELPVPGEPHLAYWHAATLLREHRGDGHVAALLALGLDPLEALVSHTATGRGLPPRLLLATRGWERSDWEAAQERLRDRGLLHPEGELTRDGVRLREELEELTDRLGREPYDHLGAEGVARLTELGRGFLHRAAAAGAFPDEVAARA